MNAARTVFTISFSALVIMAAVASAPVAAALARYAF